MTILRKLAGTTGSGGGRWGGGGGWGRMEESRRPLMREQSDLTWSMVSLPGPHQPRQTCKPWAGSSSTKTNLQALDRVLINQDIPCKPWTGSSSTKTYLQALGRVLISQDIPASPGQGAEPSAEADHWGNEDNCSKGQGKGHKHPALTRNVEPMRSCSRQRSFDVQKNITSRREGSD